MDHKAQKSKKIIGFIALLGDASEMIGMLGAPRIGIDQIVTWVAGWLASGGKTLGKPTKFESRTGKF